MDNNSQISHFGNQVKLIGGVILTLFMGIVLTGSVTAQDELPEKFRVATYNIQYLDTDGSSQRFDAVKAVIDAVDADVFALQEIDDRAALEMVFDPNEWHLVIDDQSGENQDLAVAVRKPLEVVGDLDADDEDFLFSEETDFFFPDRRDVLNVEVKIPGVEEPVHVLVVHQKARYGGRATTNPRRVGAAVKLLEELEQEFEDVPFILLGDFNDNPDDQSMNILETGDPDATIEIENEMGEFLVNLTEPLAAEGKVSNSLNNMEIDSQTDEVINIDHDSRIRNFEFHNTDTHTGNILFDQILVPRWMIGHYIEDSVVVFNGPENIGASDHLPVYADFRPQVTMTEPEIDGVFIVELLPNPVGTDAGNETVTLKNFGDEEIDLEGWRLRDRSNHTLELTGVIEAGERREITVPVTEGNRSVLPLTNSGDEISLVNAEGVTVQSVSYDAVEAGSGRRIITGPETD